MLVMATLTILALMTASNVAAITADMMTQRCAGV
jgi:hypothetical protein